MRKKLSILMVAIVILSFASCSSKDNGTTTQNETSVSTTEKENEEALLQKIRDANLLSNSLQRNESVYIFNDDDYSALTDCYFKFNSQIVRIYEEIYHTTDERIVTGIYNGMSFMSQNGERFAVKAFVDEFGSEEPEFLIYDEAIAYNLIENDLSFIEETDDYYVFRYSEVPETESKYYIEKDTLNYVRCHTDNYGHIVEENFIYNEPVELMKVFDAWNGKLKTVTVIYDGEVTSVKEFEIPYNWDILPENNNYSSPPIALYLDEGYTQEYEYPGDGVDYTIYVTTAMG